MKQKFTVEYGLKKGSIRVLWTLISTAHGLSEWMADRVESQDSIFTFTWGKGQEKAELIGMEEEKRVRFRWLREPRESYFEIAVEMSELTGEMSLIITDFAEENEKDDLILLWDSEIEKLTRRMGL